MRIVTYDCEVFAWDWVVVFKDKETGAYTVIHNDNEALTMCLDDETLYFGFNSKHYDQYIIKAIVAGLTPREVKAVSDYIIDGGQGWECPLIRDYYFRFNNVDIRDDMQQGLSLKAIEGHLYLPIIESDVDFNIDRPLKKDEIEETIFYCKHDVDCTEKIVDIRKAYIRTKSNLGKRAGIKVEKAVSLTNAKLTAQMLGASKKERNDGRDYVYPENLDKSVIPKEIISFFDTIRDKSVTDEKLFSTSFNTIIGDMPCTYAWGGVHGSQLAYHESATETRIIQNRDVASLYPTIIEEYGYLSRNVSDPNIYYQMKKDRIKAKHEGEKETSNDLKLPLNTVSGAQENKFNDLYDPLPTRSLRISGQLFMTVLAMRLLNECKTIKLLNFNTDGLMYSVDKIELPIVDRVCTEWEKETRFELEIDDISKVWIKDVNNLFLIKTDGEIKKVGGYLRYGINLKGAWSVNNNMTIVKTALIEYFANGTSIEDTVNNCDDIFQFQIIAKAGAKYSRAFHLVNGKKIPVQKVNRVYASKDKRYGKIYKVKSETNSVAMIENLPDHCIIDNLNELTIDDVDKTFYIELAQKRLNDFLGIKQKKGAKMATKKTEEKLKEAPAIADKTIDGKKVFYEGYNVWQKLILSRWAFKEGDVKKSGKNMHLSFKYFELDDIVPDAIDIFRGFGLIPIVNFTNEIASMTIVNVDNPDEMIEFTAPFKVLDPIVSSNGKQATNEMQALGSSITYMRRYLYMIALDVCESDTIDANLGQSIPVQNTKSAPPSAAQRAEIKKELTSTSSPATELQIKGLKTVLNKLRASDPSHDEYVTKVALDTNRFTNLSKEECEKLIEEANKKLEQDIESRR